MTQSWGYTYVHTRPWGLPKFTSVLLETFLGYKAYMRGAIPHPCKVGILLWPCRPWPPVLPLRTPSPHSPTNPALSDRKSGPGSPPGSSRACFLQVPSSAGLWLLCSPSLPSEAHVSFGVLNMAFSSCSCTSKASLTSLPTSERRYAGVEARAWHVLAKCCSTELCLRPFLSC